MHKRMQDSQPNLAAEGSFSTKRLIGGDPMSAVADRDHSMRKIQSTFLLSGVRKQAAAGKPSTDLIF